MKTAITPAAQPPKVIALGDAGFDRGLLLQLLSGWIVALQQIIRLGATQLGNRSTKSIPVLAEASMELTLLNALQQQVLEPLGGKIRLHAEVRPVLTTLFLQADQIAPSEALTALRGVLLDPPLPIAPPLRAPAGKQS